MKKIILIVILAVIVVAGIVYGTMHRDSGLAAVQAGNAQKHDLASIVSASGEIKPKTYVNIGANAFGKITHLYVKEGDHVKRGQLLAQIENVQPESDVQSNRAQLESSRMDDAAAQAGYQTSVYDLSRAQADYVQKKLDYARGTSLYQQQLIAKSDYDQRKAAYEMAASALKQAQAKITQMKAQQSSSQTRIKQYSAQLRHAVDALSKTTYTAPYDGVVTNLPVREGETVVLGIQNAPGSTLMTLADMSVITAEVKVDETDVINIKLNQPAEVTIDAIPNKVFQGRVSEIGDNAILRSSGVSTAQSTSGDQEAKDFKVVVTIDDPPDVLRPGLSATAKITTAKVANALAVPIQALISRKPEDLKKKGSSGPRAVNASATASSNTAEPEVQGVFVLTGAGKKKTAEFRTVTTGIYGNTDVQITGGLKDGDEVITGPFRVLRTLKDGTRVKIEVPKKEDEKS